MDKKPDGDNTFRRKTPVLNPVDDESPTTVVNEIAVGQVVAERFKVLSVLGKGGMGSVYLVEQILLGKRYALKTLLPTETTDRTLRRFQQEAKATSLLEHPNIVRLYEFGLINNVQPYFVMDYCDGQTLAQQIKDNGPLSPEKALPVCITLCNALAYAHAQGVVHRDLKPSNIMTTSSHDGEMIVKVLDFGIAKNLHESEFNTLTRTGEIFGSPYYMSPEQCLGQEIGSRSDIYSLACVFFEILAGSPPFMSENALATMLKHQSDLPPSLKEATLGRNFSADLEQIIAKMLAKNPADRYQDLLKVADDLRCLQKGEPTSLTRPRAQVKSHSPAVIGVTVIVVVALLALAIYAFLGKPPANVVRAPSRAEVTTFPSIDNVRAVGKELTVAKATGNRRFYSDQDSGKVRLFHFPAQPIGELAPLAPAADPSLYIAPKVPLSLLQIEQLHYPIQSQNEVRMHIPFSFVLEQTPRLLSGFRTDEVRNLKLHGILVDDVATEQIKNWRELDTLIIDRTEISDKSIAILKTLPKLASLSAADTNISSSGLQQLHLEKMRRLNVNRIPFASALLPKLRGSKALMRLDMAETGLKDSDLKIIAEIPNIVMLDITGDSISDQGLKQLLKLKELGYLWLSSKELTPHCLETIKKMTHLQTLAITTYNWTPQEQKTFVQSLRRPADKVALHVVISAAK